MRHVHGEATECVVFIGRQRNAWEPTGWVETGVLLIGRGVAYRKTGLHGILFISTVDPLQPPRATVHAPSTSSSLHGLLFTQPPPHATPPATVQPPLHGHPSTVYCSSSPPHHGVLYIHPHRELFIQTPQQRSLFIRRQHRSASVSRSSEGIARSGSVNSHRSITRVQ